MKTCIVLNRVPGTEQTLRNLSPSHHSKTTRKETDIEATEGAAENCEMIMELHFDKKL